MTPMKASNEAVRLVFKERMRQQAQNEEYGEGWTPDHDDANNDSGQLARAAAAYAHFSSVNDETRKKWADEGLVPGEWPWDPAWWKPKTPLRDLVRAGALVFAEIERRLRAGEKVEE